MAPSYRAAHAVLGIAELLEAILLRLPVKDLLLTQRVSRTWQATITDSPSLRKALFFEADGIRDEFQSSSCSFNPLLAVPLAYKTIILPISLVPGDIRLYAEALRSNVYGSALIPIAPPSGTAIPSEEAKGLIDKIAQYVARNGSQFESHVRAASTPESAFLWPDHEHHAYYQWRLAQLQEDKRPLVRAKPIAHLTLIEPTAWMRSDASWRRMFVSRPAVKQLGGVAQVSRPRVYKTGLKEPGLRHPIQCNLFDQNGIKGEEVLYRACQLRDSKPFGFWVSVEFQERLVESF